MPTHAVIFDLDGTLADTLADIADAMNHVLAQHGFPTHATADYPKWIGGGVRALVEGALPEGARVDVDEAVAAFRARYGAHILDKTRPYDGIPDVLAALAARGLPLAVLSNKPDPATREVTGKLFPDVPFREVRGDRAGTPKKPDPTAARAIAASLGIAPEACAFVGDSGVDVETAKRASMRAIGVLWGFRGRDDLEAAGADAIAERPADLLTLL